MNHRRSLAIVSDTLRGGVGFAVERQVEEFSSRGFQCSVLAPGAAERTEQFAPATVHDVPIPNTLSGVVKTYQARRAVRGLIERVLPEGGHVHVHGLRSLAIVAPCRHLHMTFHGAVGLPGESNLKEGLRSLALRAVPLFTRAAYSVVPLGLSGWSTLWIDAPHLSDAVQRSPARNEIPLLWVGRISRQKNFSMFVDVVKILVAQGHTVHADVVGGVDTDQEGVVARIRDMDLPISFHGQTDDVVSFLRRDTIFCLFSHFEGRPFAVEEALNAGLPIVVSDLPGNRMVVADGRCLVVSVGGAVQAINGLRHFESRRAVGEVQREDYLRIRSSFEQWADVMDRNYMASNMNNR